MDSHATGQRDVLLFTLLGLIVEGLRSVIFTLVAVTAPTSGWNHPAHDQERNETQSRLISHARLRCRSRRASVVPASSASRCVEFTEVSSIAALILGGL